MSLGASAVMGWGGQPLVAALDIFNQAQCDPPLSMDEVERIARSIERYAAGGKFVKFVNSSRSLTLGPAAFHGLAGKIVRTLAPQTEADPAALLLELLTAYGNVIGRGPHFRVGRDRHALNLFVSKVGETSRGRKGQSWGWTSDLMGRAAPAWLNDHVVSGLATGQGLIHALRDGKGDELPGDEDWTPMRDDKRVLVRETELAQVLKLGALDGNTLSTLLRNEWDGFTLQNLTKHAPEKASNPHVSIIADITKADLQKYLAAEDYSNGFANRFLWVCTKRSKLLPDGGEVPEETLTQLGSKLAHAISFASKVERMERAEDAKGLWWATYHALDEEVAPGVVGDVTARAEAQIMRLACLYALLDSQTLVHVDHLKAALAVWNYCFASACVIFGGKLGHRVADTIYQALLAAPDGLVKSAIFDLFQRNLDAAKIDHALEWLEAQGLATQRQEQSVGTDKPTERWFAIPMEPTDRDEEGETPSDEAAAETKTAQRIYEFNEFTPQEAPEEGVSEPPPATTQPHLWVVRPDAAGSTAEDAARLADLRVPGRIGMDQVAWVRQRFGLGEEDAIQVVLLLQQADLDHPSPAALAVVDQITRKEVSHGE